MPRGRTVADAPPKASLRDVETLIAAALAAAVVAEAPFEVLDHLLDALRGIQKGPRTSRD